MRILQWAHGKFQNSDREALERCKDSAQQTHRMHSGTAGEVELQKSNRRRQRVVGARSSVALGKMMHADA